MTRKSYYLSPKSVNNKKGARLESIITQYLNRRGMGGRGVIDLCLGTGVPPRV